MMAEFLEGAAFIMAVVHPRTGRKIAEAHGRRRSDGLERVPADIRALCGGGGPG